MSQEPVASIIIMNYNYADFLSIAISSALSQTYPNVEVVVVDDGSTDNSRDIINAYGEKIVPVFKKNGGQASALNAGYKVCKGDIICFLDADDLFLPEKVAQVVKTFQKYPEAEWVFNQYVSVETKEITDSTLYELFESIQTENSEGEILKIDFRKNLNNGKFPTFMPSTSNLSFSRKLLNEIFRCLK